MDDIPDDLVIDYMIFQVCNKDLSKKKHVEENYTYEQLYEWFCIAIYDIYVQNEQMKD